VIPKAFARPFRVWIPRNRVAFAGHLLEVVMLSRSLGKFALRLGAAAFAVALAGCATPPPGDDAEAKAEFEQINDPLEPTNRVIFQFNEGVDTVLLRPLAEGYRYAVPPFGRDRVADFLDNLKSPLYLGNDLLQGNLTLAATTLGRFLLNTTFGVFGIMDVADPCGLPAHRSDLGQTLGVWGVGEGFYLVLPLFGPSNPRDGFGLAVEWYADPLDLYLASQHEKWLSWTRTGVGAVSQREAYLDLLDDVQRTSLDYYSAMRSLYRQRRAAEIGGAINPGQYMPPPAAQLQLNRQQHAEAQQAK
jgi:phospholipid-binding lipoprotein MlaA